MNILIHTRLMEAYEAIRVVLEARSHHVECALTLGDGKRMMVNGSYDKVFIGIGVSGPDRVELMAAGGELGMSLVEIIDADTVMKEIMMHSPTGKHPTLGNAQTAKA